MPTRLLPKTDDERSDALSTSNIKYQNTTAALQLITDEQFATLGSVLSPWRAARLDLGPLRVAQTTATSNCTKAFNKCVKNISHFIQVLNLAIDREVLAPSVSGFYQLPTGHAKVPVMNTTAEALHWAAKLEAGEGERISQGDAPLQ